MRRVLVSTVAAFTCLSIASTGFAEASSAPLVESRAFTLPTPKALGFAGKWKVLTNDTRCLYSPHPTRATSCQQRIWYPAAKSAGFAPNQAAHVLTEIAKFRTVKLAAAYWRSLGIRSAYPPSHLVDGTSWQNFKVVNHVTRASAQKTVSWKYTGASTHLVLAVQRGNRVSVIELGSEYDASLFGHPTSRKLFAKLEKIVR